MIETGGKNNTIIHKYYGSQIILIRFTLSFGIRSKEHQVLLRNHFE